MVCWSQAGLILPLGSQYCVLTSPRDLVSYQGLLALHETVWLSEFGEGEDLLLFQLGKLLFSVKFVVLMNEWFQFPLAGGEYLFHCKKKKKKRVQDASDRRTRTIITTKGQVKRMLQIAACDHLIRCIEACELMSPYSCLKIFCVWVKT